MGFGFNFKDYNDRLTFKKPILKEVKQTLDEQDFAKAEIAKEKKQKLKKFKEKTPQQRSFFCRAVALEKIRRIFGIQENEGGYYDRKGFFLKAERPIFSIEVYKRSDKSEQGDFML